MLNALLLSAWLGALPVHAQVCDVQIGQRGVALRTVEKGALRPILNGISYRANDMKGLVFETQAATRGPNGRVVFALEGPGAEHASVVAALRSLRRGISVDWAIRYSGPERKWNRWTSGFRFDFAEEITDAKTMPVTTWIAPTGKHPWEVPGDTPYPDTECQIRQVFFGDTALAMVSSTYDADWIYRRNVQRARFWKACPPAKPPCELHTRMTLLVVRSGGLAPPRLAAEAAGRPMALYMSTERVGNLFEPGEPVEFHCTVHNVTDRPQAGRLHLEAWTYQGHRLLAESTDVKPPPLGKRVLSRRAAPKLRGVVFVTGRLTWPGGEAIQRMNVGVLPKRPTSAPLPDSPFGMAAVIANPQRYPDQFDMPTVLAHMQRIGVRWIRSSWFPFRSEITDAHVQQARNRVALLRRCGILPHVQLGSRVPKPDELAAFKQHVAASVGRFLWVSRYIEIGNELNFKTQARDYVDKMLRPVSETMRQVFPGGKVMSMGLGGVHKKWLDAFVAAGGMEWIDVLSVHPGCQPRAPEFWKGWRGWVFRPQMLDATKAAAAHGGKEVWITEAYAPSGPGRSRVDVRTAADYMVRTYVCALALGVKVIEWYQFQDGTWYAQRERPDNGEYNFGMVYVDLSPKPQYVAYAAMTEQLEGARYQARLDLGADDLYGVRFLKRGQPIDVLWSYREKHETDLAWWPKEKFKNDSRKPGEPWVERWQTPVTVDLPAVADTVAVTDAMGNTRHLRAERGKIKLCLTGSPVYVRGLGAARRLAEFWGPIE